MAIVIFYSYFLGKLLFKDKIFQYATALLFCFIPPINLYGRSVFQPHFVIPFLLMSLYYFFAAFKHKSNSSLLLAIVFYFVSLNFHYSSLIILPWVLGITIYLQYKINLNINTTFRWKKFLSGQFSFPLLIIFLNFYFLVINQLMIRGLNQGAWSFYDFIYKIFLINPKFYLQNIVSNLHVADAAFTGTNEFIYTKFFLYLLFIFILFLFFLRKKTFYSVNSFLILLLFPLSFLVITGDFNLPENYFVVFYIVLPIFLISVVANLQKKAKVFVFLALFIIFLSLSAKQFNGIKYSSNQELINKYELAADVINNDAKNNLANQSDFFLFVIDGQLDWSSPAYWYYLENKSGLQLVENSSYKYNIVSIHKESKNVYLICDNPSVIWDEHNENLCLERFIRNKVLENYHQIFFADKMFSGLSNFSIYRLQLIEPIGRQSVYGLASIRN